MSTEKESSGNRDVEKCAVILLDIAGTTTSNSFIKDTLFPFAVSNAEEYLKSHWNEEVVKDAVKQLNEYNENISVSEVAGIIKTATEKDEDNKGVKTLQGLIYRQGYEDGKLKAPVFPDVSSSLESWSKNHRVAIYSSGSIESQKLLFAHTAEGDLSASIAQYFDLSVGSKAEVSSYEKIAKELAVAPEEIIYINDDIEEAKAASQAGLKSILIIREGNANIPEEKQKEFKVIKSFADLSMEVSGKRKIEEEETAEEPPTKVAKTEEDDEEKKNVIAEEEPMEIDSTNEIKDDKAGESELESASNKDENVMETDVKVNAENEKTEIETDQREDALNEAVQKSDAEITDGKSAVDLEARQTNSDSIQRTPDSSEKFEGFSEKKENVSSEVLADSTEKLTDSVVKMEDMLKTEPPLTGIASLETGIEADTSKTEKLTDSVDKKEEPLLPEIISAVIETDTSEVDSTEKSKDTKDKMEDVPTTELPLTDSSETDSTEKLTNKTEPTTKSSVTEMDSAVIDTSEIDSTEKLADSGVKMEDIPTTELSVTGSVSTVIEKVTSNTDSTEKLTDSADKMEDVQTTEPPRVEVVDKVIEKDTSKTDSAEELTNSMNKEDITTTTKPPLTGTASAVIEKVDASKADSTEKLIDSVEKMEDILTTDPLQNEIVCEVIERGTSKTDSAEKLSKTDTPDTVSMETGENSTVEGKTISENDKVDNAESNDKVESKLHEKSKEDEREFHIEVSEADDGGNKETQSEVVDKKMDTLSTDAETKTANEETGDALMEVCESTVDKIEEQINTNNVEERHNKCKNICNKENSESSKTESAHVNNEEINTAVTQGDDVESSTSTGALVQTQECTSNEVRNECEKKKEEAESTEKISTEKNVVDCEMKEIDGTEDKVNGNEAESSRSDEKENKSELANGTTSVETGSDVNENGDVANPTEEEIKVKKLEENPDSTAVSVEA